MLLNAEFNIGCVQTLCQKSGIYESIRDAEFVYGIKYVHENLNKDGNLNKNAKGFNSNMCYTRLTL